MEENKLSVSMCVYGKDDPVYFDVALKSITEQTRKPDEIVLTVDGEVPVTIEDVINGYQEILENTDISFKVIWLPENVGHGNARKKCVENCSYPLVAIMDADDISVPTRFEKQTRYMEEHKDISIVGGYITEFISSDDPANASYHIGNRIIPEKDDEIKKYMRKRCPMNQVTVMFKKADVLEVGGYIDWYCEEDYYLWTRLALAGKKFANIPETLVNVRVDREVYQRRGGRRYFHSEKRLQQFMLKEKLICLPRYAINVLERFIIQVMMPNRVRSWVFHKLIRNNKEINVQ